VIVLEFGQPAGHSARCSVYSRGVMPLLGGLLTGNRKAYEYCRGRRRRFLPTEKFLALMQQSSAFSRSEAHASVGDGVRLSRREVECPAVTRLEEQLDIAARAAPSCRRAALPTRRT